MKTLREIHDEQDHSTKERDADDQDHQYRYFDQPYDHVNHYKDGTSEDLEKINVLESDVHEYAQAEGQSLGRLCQPFDWVAVHYTAKMDNRGHPK